MAAFDYRKLIETPDRPADWYNPQLRALFTTINRMAALTAGINFATLYNAPLKTVGQKLKDNLKQIRAEKDPLGLIEYPDEVSHLLDQLMIHGANWSFYKLTHSKAGQHCSDIDDILLELHLRHGIYFPMPVIRDREEHIRSLRDLIVHAGNCTYRDAFEKKENEFDSPHQWSAIFYARQAGILDEMRA